VEVIESLPREGINYGGKQFYTTGPWPVLNVDNEVKLDVEKQTLPFPGIRI